MDARRAQGIARYREKHGGAWGRLAIDWLHYDAYRAKGLKNTACAALFGMTTKTLKKRPRERQS